MQHQVIDLPIEVEPKFFSEDGVKGMEIFLTKRHEVIMVMRLMRKRPEWDIPDMDRLCIREVDVDPVLATPPPSGRSLVDRLKFWT